MEKKGKTDKSAKEDMTGRVYKTGGRLGRKISLADKTKPCNKSNKTERAIRTSREDIKCILDQSGKEKEMKQMKKFVKTGKSESGAGASILERKLAEILHEQVKVLDKIVFDEETGIHKTVMNWQGTSKQALQFQDVESFKVQIELIK